MTPASHWSEIEDMPLNARTALLLAAAPLAAAPAIAQYAPATGYPQGQPGPYSQSPGYPQGQQGGYPQGRQGPYAQRQQGPSLVGIWDGQARTPQGTFPATVEYRADGTAQATTQAMIPGYVQPVLMHMAGRYQVQSNGPGRFSVHISISRTAPSEVCEAVNAGPATNCRPFTMPPSSDGTASFNSPDSFVDETGVTWTRANGPGLLAQRVPPRLVLNTNAPPPGYNGGGGGSGGGGGGGYVPSNRPVAVAHPGNLQQERICSINGGTLVTYADGREECKSPY